MFALSGFKIIKLAPLTTSGMSENSYFQNKYFGNHSYHLNKLLPLDGKIFH